MPARQRAVRRIAETQSPPRIRLGHGYGDPTAQQAELVNMLHDPAVPRASTIAERFPSRAVLPRAEPLRLNADDGTLLLMTGDILNGQKVG